MGRLILLLTVAGVAHADPPAWSLKPSDFLRYELRSVTTKDGKEKFGKGAILTIHGHDIRDGGQYLPVAPRLKDLPVVLGFRMAGGLRRLHVLSVIRLRIKGDVETMVLDDASTAITASYVFASRGEDEKSDKYRLRGGKAHVRAVFDRKTGVVTSTRITIGYVQQKLDPKPGEKPKRVAKVWDIRLKSRKEERHKGFRKEVDGAIARGVKHLRTLQKEDGTFEPHGKYEVGTTALAVLTLVACDVPRADPTVKKALDWMFAQPPPKKTYERAVALMAADRAYAPAGEMARARRKAIKVFQRDLPPDRRAWCAKAAAALVGSALTGGSWSYPSGTGGGRFRGSANYDSSNTQYAVLGLRAAWHLGIPAPEKTWLGVVRHFERVREKEGKRGRVLLHYEGQAIGTVAAVPVARVAGFRYKITTPQAWGSMTCAGIASLAIARDQLRRVRSGKLAGLKREIEQMILGGWAWLDQNWAVDRNPHKSNWYYYYLYSLERAALLTGVKRVVGRDWYYEGAVQIIERQGKKGEWDEPGKGTITETCFALLFLKRATAPIAATTPSGR